MKRILVAALAVTAILATGGTVNAGPGNIRWTVHNMGKTTPWGGGSSRHWYSTDVDEVCIFCHTPHNAKPAVPLWNKVNPTQTFKMYTSSPTLSTEAKRDRQPGPESLLCLSCHDGRTAINVLHNSSVGFDSGDGSGDKRVPMYGFPTGTDPNNPNPQALALGSLPTFGTSYRVNLGKTGDTGAAVYDGSNLMDDHPISFSYTKAQTEKTSQLNGLATVNAKSGGKIRFFGSDNRLECSSCHDPHVDYGYDFDGLDTNTYANHTPQGDHALRPFLVMSNDNSAMCFACHNK